MCAAETNPFVLKFGFDEPELKVNPFVEKFGFEGDVSAEGNLAQEIPQNRAQEKTQNPFLLQFPLDDLEEKPGPFDTTLPPVDRMGRSARAAEARRTVRQEKQEAANPPDWEQAFYMEGEPTSSPLSGMRARAATLFSDFFDSVGMREEAKKMRKAEAKFNYTPMVTPETWKEAFNKGEYGTILQTLPTIAVEGFAQSVPDMLAMFNPVLLGPYILSRNEGMARERAENDGKTAYGDWERLTTLPTAITSILVDRLALFGHLKAGTGALGEATLMGGKELTELAAREAGKGALREGSQEGFQESVEYVGTHLGTEEGTDVGEMALRTGFGATTGALIGGGISSATSLYNQNERSKALVELDKYKTWMEEQTRILEQRQQTYEAGDKLGETFQGPLTEEELGRLAALKQARAELGLLYEGEISKDIIRDGVKHFDDGMPKSLDVKRLVNHIIYDQPGMSHRVFGTGPAEFEYDVQGRDEISTLADETIDSATPSDWFVALDEARTLVSPQTYDVQIWLGDMENALKQNDMKTFKEEVATMLSYVQRAQQTDINRIPRAKEAESIFRAMFTGITLKTIGVQSAFDQVKPGQVMSLNRRFSEDFLRYDRNSAVASSVPARDVEASISMLQDLVNTFAPDMRLALYEESGFATEAKAYGTAGHQVMPDGSIVQIITLKTRAIENKAARLGIPFRVAKNATLLHEFGHALAHYFQRSAPLSLQKGLVKEYLDQMGKWYPDTPLQRLLQERNNQINYLDYSDWFGNDLRDLGTSTYQMSFAEWMAEQTSRYLLNGGQGMATSTQIAAREMNEALKGVYAQMGGDKVFQKIWPKFPDYLNALRYRAIQSPEQRFWFTEESTPEIEKKIAEIKEEFAPKASRTPEQELAWDTVLRGLPKFNSFMKQALTLPQIERENKDVPGVTRFVEGVRNWWRSKGVWTDLANQTLVFADELGISRNKEELKAFETFAFRVTLESSDLGRKLKPEELQKIISESRISEKGIKLWERMQRDFLMALNKFQQLSEAQIERQLADDPIAMQIRKEKLREEMKQLRDHDYFPLARFGRYAITVKAEKDVNWKGKEWKAGQTMYFSLSESKRDRDRELARVRREIPGVANARTMQDRDMAYVSMPEFLVERIQELAMTELAALEEAGISAEMLGEFRAGMATGLEQISLDLSPAESFRKSMLKRKSTPGFSEDALRAYASYFQHFANFISRLEHSSEMLEGIKDIGRYSQELSLDPKVQQKRVDKGDQLQQYFSDHYSYLMNPGSEWAGLRSFGAFWFLGFNVRSALVNMTQIPLATYPYLAARFGDAGAIAELGRAVKDLSSTWRRGRDGAVEWDLAQMIEAGFDAQFLNESLATELGTYAEAGNLARAMPGVNLARGKIEYHMKMLPQHAMWMFQQAEKMNRLITFSAAYRLARNKALGDLNAKSLEDLAPDIQDKVMQEAFQAGRSAIETTQGEYARWARPNIMKGKKSALFLFKLYMQHMVYLMARDPGKYRFLAMSIMMGGLLGMPFAEDLLALLQAGLNMASPNRKVDLKLEARELANEVAETLHIAPDLLLKGAGHYGFGALFPFDLHASLSLGKIVPGMERMGQSTGPFNSSPEARLGQLTADLLGPIGQVPLGMYKAMASDDFNEWKRIEMALPKFMAGISGGVRYGVQGAETGSRGEKIAEFDPYDPMGAVEVVGKAAGFSPRKVTEEREKRWAQRQALQFYQARRTVLMRQVAEMRLEKDREGLKDALAAVRKYNIESRGIGVPILSDDLRQSLKRRDVGRIKAERGIPDSGRSMRIYKEVDALFSPDVSEERAP